MESIGIIYGTASSTRFDVAMSDPSLRRLDYVATQHDGHQVLCQVDDVVRKGGLSFDDAVANGRNGHGAASGISPAGSAIPATGPPRPEDKLSASVQVVGYVDAQGRVQTPLTPFAAGQPVTRADTRLVTSVLGLEGGNDGAYIGRIKGTRIPVRLGMNVLAQKHVSVLAKTGAGKSYTVGVLLEEFLAAGVPLVILDPHGEYGSLRHASIDETEIAAMADHHVKPRSFDKEVKEYAIDTDLNPEADKLRLEGVNLEGQQIVDLLGGKISGGQVGVLYQAINEVKEHMPSYTLTDVMDAVQQNRSTAKWNVINALEALQATGVFHIRGTPIKELVQPKQCTIINLKGVSPDIQEVAVTRLTGLLWEARKRGEVPPFILVCEEAHNFCPERGVGSAISGAVIRTVASEGRKFGMGLVIVSQRPAKIDKNVLSQCNTQFVLKVTNPNDLKAIVSSVEGITGNASDEVQRLPIGTALIAGGGLTQPVFVDVRPRLTRHGGRSIDVVGGKQKAAITRPKMPRLPGQPDRAAERGDGRAPPPTGSSAPRPATSIVRAARSAQAPPASHGVRGDDARAATHSSEAASGPPRRERPDWMPPASGAAPARAPPQAPASKNAAPAHETDTTRRRAVRASDPARAPQDKLGSAGTPWANMPSAPEMPRSRAQATPGPKWTKKEAPDIQRVAARVGIVSEDRDPADAVEFIQYLARQNGRNPDMRVGLYAEIARTVCHEDLPACIRCPLSAQCQFHQRLQTERKKNRNPIRRLWSR